MNKSDNLVGMKFGRLEFVRIIPERARENRVVAIWKCDCGKEAKAVVSRVKSGQVSSCGCSKENARIASTTHGMRNTAEYRTWVAINNRCHCETSKDFHKYGGRGIFVADEWRNDFSAFFAHIGKRPSSGMQIDRIDNERGYVPGNVRWVTPETNSRNRSNSKDWVINGQRFESITDAATSNGVSTQTIFRWVNGAFDKRRGTTVDPKPGCYCIDKYGDISGKDNRNLS